MPNALLLGGEVYPIRTDFRTGIAYQRLAAQGNLDAVSLLLLWFPDRIPADISAALEGIHCFYRRTEELPEDSAGAAGPIPYDFTVDAGAIVADFQRRYGIDLTDPGLTMHWWRFMALMDGLYSYGMADRVGFRVADLSGLDAKQRSKALKMRQKYAINSGETVKDHLAMLDDVIARNRGDTSG